MNSFYSTLYGKFASLQIEQAFSPKLIYPANTWMPYLKIGNSISNCKIGIPSIRMTADKVSYGIYDFENSEFGQSAAVKLAISSTYLLGAKVIFHWLYRDYLKEWISSKADIIRASFAINIIFDLLSAQRIRHIEGDELYDDVFGDSNTLSTILLKHDSKNFSELAQIALASHLMGSPTYAPSPIMKIVREFLAELNGLKFDSLSLIEIIKQHILIDEDGIVPDKIEVGKTEIGWDELVEIADNLYDIIIKIPGKWHAIYLPYSHPLIQDIATFSQYTDLFKSNLIIQPEFEKIRKCKAKQNQDDLLWNEIFFELSREENRREKMLLKMSQATKNSNFVNIGFPTCDYVSYYRLNCELAPQIRRIIEQVRMVKNVLDENTLEESGNIDLQVAIQAVASETPRSDIFTKEENLLKSESWTILVDSSMSLGGSSKEVKAVSVCLAETAREVMGSNPWGMFAFSDELYCIKDFTEHYDNQIKSRIGGMTQNGLSYIPDAIRACRNLILEYARDRNYLILVSDGNPTGYLGIEEDFKASVKELGRYGINIAGIGIVGSGIQKTIRGARIINTPSDIVKEFMTIYYGLSG